MNFCLKVRVCIIRTVRYADKNKCIYYCDNGGDAGEEMREEQFKGVSKDQTDETQKRKHSLAQGSKIGAAVPTLVILHLTSVLTPRRVVIISFN